MVRRETVALDQVRGLVTGEGEPGGHWAPGLLALYTELVGVAPLDRKTGMPSTPAPTVLSRAGAWGGSRSDVRPVGPSTSGPPPCARARRPR